MHMSHSSGPGDGSTPPSAEEQRAIQLRYNPPENEIPGVIAFSALLGRSDDAVVALVGARAYSAGIEFEIAVRLRRYDDTNPSALNDAMYGGRRTGSTDKALLLGAEYPDGRRASSLSGPSFSGFDLPTVEPTLSPGRGGGSATSQQMTFWLHPLPPPGDVILISAWPALEVPERQTVIAGDLIAAGFAAIVELWPWEPPVENAPVPPPRRPDLAPGSWFGPDPD
jgi:hypothetical protein